MAASTLSLSAIRVMRSASAIICKPVSGSHVLRIDGYSQLKDLIEHPNYITSCDFSVGGYMWRLMYYPNGSRSKFKNHISVLLQLASYPGNEVVKARSRFSLLGQFGNPAFTHSVEMHNFSRLPHGSGWGEPSFITRKELEESEYLKDDRLAIQCDVTVATVRTCSDHWAFISRNPESDAT